MYDTFVTYTFPSGPIAGQKRPAVVVTIDTSSPVGCTGTLAVFTKSTDGVVNTAPYILEVTGATWE